ncbi:MAG: hypothetical protein WBA22_10495 [Candidatus Methanofastidiosia archaeon]
MNNIKFKGNLGGGREIVDVQYTYWKCRNTQTESVMYQSLNDYRCKGRENP